MRALKPISRADEALIAEILSKGGPAVSPRQLERWRQRGAIPEHPRPGLGKGKGSESEDYPEGTAEQVVELVDLLDRHRSLPKAILILFCRGWPIGERGLKDAYGWAFDLAERSFLSMAQQGDSELGEDPGPDEIAEASAVPF